MINPEFHLREATMEDMWNIYELANSPEVRSVSFHQDSITKNEHQKWYRNKLADKKCTTLIVTDNYGTFMGTVRLDSQDYKNYIITIYLVDKFRGKGIGTRVIKQASAKVSLTPHTSIRAFIMADNLASLISFQRAGYRIVQNSSLKDKKFLELRYN